VKCLNERPKNGPLDGDKTWNECQVYLGEMRKIDSGNEGDQIIRGTHDKIMSDTVSSTAGTQ